MFKSGAAVALIEAGGVFSGTGGRDSEGSTDCGAGVVADTVFVGVEGTCVGPGAGAGLEAEGGAGAGAGAGAGTAAGWGVG